MEKGQTYGTILVDLESHKPIEVLPDRSTQTAETWLRKHPEIEVVSRDRGGNYAAAARNAAPQAQQVADRFHLLKNLRESLKEFMARKQKTLPEVEDTSSDGVPEKARGKKLSTEEGWQEVLQEKRFRTMSPHLRQRPVGAIPTLAEFRRQVSRENRLARYEAVRTLHEQAFSMEAIARRLNISTHTVRRFLTAEAFPEITPPPYRGSILDPYKPYILTRWQQGCFNGAQLYEEIKAQGYTGSASGFRRFVADLRKKHRLAGDSTILTLDPLSAKVNIPAGVDPAPQVKARLSATRASWLCVSQPAKPDERHLQQLELLRRAHPDFEKAYQLSQAFVSMLKERRGVDLDAWLNRAEHSGIAEI